MQSTSRLVGEFLVNRKVLSKDTLEELLLREQDTGVPLAKILAGEGLVAERDLVAAIADQMGLNFWDPVVVPVSPMVEAMVPPELARKYVAIAVAFSGNGLVVAMENPSDEAAVKELGRATGWSVIPWLGARTDIVGTLNQMYGPVAQPEEHVAEMPRQLSLNQMLSQGVAERASDLHLTAGRPPMIRVDGDLRPLEGYEELKPSQIRDLVYAILSSKLRERFEEEQELDTSHVVPSVGRFRVNVFFQRDSVGAVLRSIPFEIRSLEELGMPPSVSQFAELPRGLVLVTGPTGSGKSTTLAALVDVINQTKPLHIMSVEDPIEYLHHHKVAVVNQREVGEDTKGFANALKHVLRQDPDVILVGEMRDLETISTALTAAETGHLVFATLHTQDAPQSVDRIIDVFPSHQQQQVRTQLATTIQGIVTQQLLPRAGGTGRVVACEILVATPAVRNLIREGKSHQIYSVMQAGAKYGMITMDQYLAHLVKQHLVERAVAEERCQNPDDLQRLIEAA